MTIAICIGCGAQKFGAFNPCKACGHQPVALMDKAKSIMLSDHNFPIEELQEFGLRIKSGKAIPYDPVVLVSLAKPIFEADYYREKVDDEGRLPCVHCQSIFAPADEEVYCPRCLPEIDGPLAICQKCPAVYEEGARYCPRCGTPLRADPCITVWTLSEQLAFVVRRVLANDVIAGTKFLKEIFGKLSADDQVSSEYELELLGLYIGLVAVANMLPSTAIFAAIRREMLELHRLSFAASGAPAKHADQASELYLKHFSEYDSVGTQGPDRFTLLVAGKAVENCFGVKPGVGEAIEMSAVMARFGRVFTEVLTSLLSESPPR